MHQSLQQKQLVVPGRETDSQDTATLQANEDRRNHYDHFWSTSKGGIYLLQAMPVQAEYHSPHPVYGVNGQSIIALRSVMGRTGTNP